MRKKFYIIVSLFLIIIVFIVCFIFYKNKIEKLKNNSVLNEVTLISGDVYFKINIDTKETRKDDDFDLSNFSGLPKEYKNLQNILSNKIRLISNNKKQLLVSSVFEKINSEIKTGDWGYKEVINTQEYVCSIETKKCVKSSYFNEANKKILEDLKTTFVSWEYWDSEKNLLYGFIGSEGIGYKPPIYIYDMNKNTYKKTINHDFRDEEEKKDMVFNVPYNFMSPSLSKFVILGEKYSDSSNKKLLLFNINNLSKPFKEIDINGLCDSRDENIGAVTWYNNEKKIALVCRTQIYILDLNTEKYSLVYQNKNYIGSGLGWSRPVLSPNERYLVYYETPYAGNSGNIIKSVDLKNKNRVINILNLSEDCNTSYCALEN